MPASCWCMWWRERAGDAAKNEEAMRERVTEGSVPGLIAYVGDTAVGWVSVAPRPSFGQLLRSRKLRPTDAAGDGCVFAITCFYVDSRWKRRGVGRFLAQKAIQWAAGQGAAIVEAYPSARPDYMGAETMYSDLGFELDRRVGSRSVVRLIVTAELVSSLE